MKKSNIFYAISVILFVASMPALARFYEAKTVTTVATGEAIGANIGVQCFFRTSDNPAWRRIPQSPTGKTNCDIILSAFNFGKSVSFDVHANGDVVSLCVSSSGPC